MTVPSLSQDELIQLLKENGFVVISTEYLDEYNRVIVEKDGHTFPVQMNLRCYFPMVVKICMSLGISAPAEHQKCYDQWDSQIRKHKKSESREEKDE